MIQKHWLISFAGFCFLFLFLGISASTGQVRLPALVDDGMILQRDVETRIWGWASPGEEITISIGDHELTAQAGEDEKWEVALPAFEAGGPYVMEISGKNEIRIEDILFGDVWFCSGQSNMELPVRRVIWEYEELFDGYENNFIRQFKVPQTYNFKKRLHDYGSGKWVAADENSVLDFSAVAFFFAKNIYEKYNVPVGLINTAIGGSPAEAWMSRETLKEFPEHIAEMQRMKSDSLIRAIEAADQKRQNAWYQLLDEKDKAYQGDNTAWSAENVDMTDWKSIEVPGYWDKQGLEPVDGRVWYRRNFELNADQAGKEGLLLLGRIVDADSAFINGQYVGNITYQYPPRRYDIPEGLLKDGENTIVVRVINNSGIGGFVPDKPYQIDFEDSSVDLTGAWKYRIGAEMKSLGGSTFIRWKPGGLFNAMVAPVLNYQVKGVIWYQGESNAARSEEYRELFPALIRDWRKNFSQEELPFLFVQLANFMEAKEEPTESDWAMLREAQAKALKLPITGMVVAIDAGEWNDIHPLDKETIGDRLALSAQKVAYNEEDVVASGPVFKSMEIKENKIILSFDHIGGGLKNKGGKLKEFAIAGEDNEFVWANAKIEGDKVIVWHEDVLNPVAVRYAWADNPDEANLYNEEGLPAAPFRTDEW
jgi:sialate O-acetylesterase